MRVLVLVSPKHSLAQDASGDKVIREALKSLNLSPCETYHKYLVNQIWDIVNTFVVDLYHETYDYSTAHIKCDIPVIIVHCSSRKSYLSLASRSRRDEVNSWVSNLHDLNGWAIEPPFVDDHSLGNIPRYANPRSLLFATSASDVPHEKAHNAAECEAG